MTLQECIEAGLVFLPSAKREEIAAEVTFSKLKGALAGKEIRIKFSLPSGDFTEIPKHDQALAYLERIGKRHGASFDYDPPVVEGDVAYLGPRAGIVFTDKREGYDIYFT